MEKIGHRGAKALVDENTLESIQKAIDLGVDAIEIDIHCCKTGELIVIHDSSLDRTTNGTGEITELTYNEIQNFKTTSGYTIPTLKNTLNFCSKKCHIHIELKGKGTAKKTAELISTLVKKGNWNYDELTISSFKLSRLKKIQKINPSIRLGIIADKNLDSKLKLASKNNLYSFYGFHKKINKKTIDLAKQHNLKMYCWTANKRKDIKRMIHLEIDGIITDSPEKL